MLWDWKQRQVFSNRILSVKSENMRITTDPICSSHLHYDLNGSRIEVASISSHHHSGALPVPQVDGREDTLNEVVQIVLFRPENMHLLPQTTGPRPLIRVRSSRQSQHLQGTIVHCSTDVRKWGRESERICYWVVSSQLRERENRVLDWSREWDKNKHGRSRW